MGHHRQELLWAVIRAMRVQVVKTNDIVVHQGQVSQQMYIVAEGVFEMLARRPDGSCVTVLSLRDAGMCG
ncbi:unnamed protein product [Effrenium voratum]|uniref:Cyclic nucleotide-binding domain-containing protein n=1 Tax=Effrenium voratum TaxID=2562239 RepID=A0AA36HSN5_9DINO|nr:unnamed protein product [Effrenium voratum]